MASRTRSGCLHMRGYCSESVWVARSILSASSFTISAVVKQLVQSKYNAVEDLWSDFVKYAKDNMHELRDRLTELANERDQLDKMNIQLRQAYRAAHFHVHRVSYPPRTAHYHLSDTQRAGGSRLDELGFTDR